MKRLTLLLILTMTGCAGYHSNFVVPMIGTISLPKDSKFDELKLEVETNKLTLTITKGDFKMNPAVIDSKTAHDKAIIESTAAAIVDVGSKMVK